MSTSALRLVWFGLLLGVVLLLAAAPSPEDPALFDLPAARADDDDGGDEGADPFGDDGEDEEDDFFDTPTTFTKEQVEKAILKGATWLKTHQHDDGSWGEIGGGVPYGGGQGEGYPHPAGPTALAVYALLKCKVPLRDPSVKKALAFLERRHEKPGGAYETSMLLLAVCGTANPYKTSRAAGRRVEKLKLKGKYRRWAQKLHDHLLEKKTDRTWRYQVANAGATPGGTSDLSSTQLAALALFAARRLKIKTPPAVWEDILRFSLDQQDESGPEVVTKDPLTGGEIRRQARGFSYIKGESVQLHGQPIGSMTACGIANVLMARHALTDGGKKQEEWDARPEAKEVQRSIEDGIAWLEENWSNYMNPRAPPPGMYNIYWLYAVERAMDLIDHQKIGTHLWYSEMGQQLLNHQNDDGSWNSQTTLDPKPVLDTAFALLFLKKATQGQIPFPSITGGSDEPPVDNR